MNKEIDVSEVHMCIYIYAYMHVCAYFYTRICMFLHMYVYIYTFMYVYIHIYISIHIYIYIFMYTHTYTHISLGIIRREEPELCAEVGEQDRHSHGGLRGRAEEFPGAGAPCVQPSFVQAPKYYTIL